MKVTRPGLCAMLFVSWTVLAAQQFSQEVPPTTLPDGTQISHVLYFSHNKLRRGTTLQVEIITFHQETCMNVADDSSSGRQKPRLEFDPVEGFQVQGPKFLDPGPGGRSVGGVTVLQCVTGSLQMKIKSKGALKPGTYPLHGKLIWQPVTANGMLPAQTTELDLRIEVVGRKDPSVQFDGAFAKEFSPWKYAAAAPLLPAYLVGCLFPDFRAKYCTD